MTFFIKYTTKRDADHLLTALIEQYVISEYWEAKLCCGVNMEWNYTKRTYKLSMSEYINEALKSFQHSPPSRAQHAPHPWAKSTFGQKFNSQQRKTHQSY